MSKLDKFLTSICQESVDKPEFIDWLKNPEQRELRNLIKEVSREVRDFKSQIDLMDTYSIPLQRQRVQEVQDLFNDQLQRTKNKVKLTATLKAILKAKQAFIEVEIANKKTARILEHAKQLAEK